MDTHLKREFNAEFINSVLNHPSVREGALVQGFADCQPLLDDPRNHLLSYDNGAIFFKWVESGVYDIHIQALKAGRGKAFRKALQEAFEYMFTQTDCEKILAKVMKDNLTCKAVALKTMNLISEDTKHYYFERSTCL